MVWKRRLTLSNANTRLINEKGKEMEDWKKIRQKTEQRRIERQIKAGRHVKNDPARQSHKSSNPVKQP